MTTQQERMEQIAFLGALITRTLSGLEKHEKSPGQIDAALVLVAAESACQIGPEHARLFAESLRMQADQIDERIDPPAEDSRQMVLRRVVNSLAADPAARFVATVVTTEGDGHHTEIMSYIEDPVELIVSAGIALASAHRVYEGHEDEHYDVIEAIDTALTALRLDEVGPRTIN